MTQPLRILVVEDTMIVAKEISRMVEQFGCEVVGPVGSLREAEHAAADQELDGALLDVNLQNEPVYSAADILMSRGVPVAFLTGYMRDTLPDRFRDMPCLEKPFGTHELADVMKSAFGYATPTT